MSGKKTSKAANTATRGRTPADMVAAGPMAGPVYQGLVAVTDNKDISGWVVRTGDHSGGIVVGLFSGDKLIGMTVANVFRPDVQSAGLGDGRSGFLFVMTPDIIEAASRESGYVDVRVMQKPSQDLGRVMLLGASGVWMEPEGKLAASCRDLLMPDLEAMWRLSRRLDEFGESAGFECGPLKPHDLLFSLDQHIPGAEVPAHRRLPAYLDYVRYRMRVENSYDIEANPEEPDHFIDFYLKAYGAHRPGLRIPLSADTIARLNQPIVMAGQQFSLSRYVWWRLLEKQHLLQSLNLHSISGFDAIAFWWAWDEAKALQVEDCLVPANMIQRLRTVRPERRPEKCQISLFMEFVHQNNPEFHFLDQSLELDRVLFVLCLMVKAVNRPDLLRYLPPQTLAKMLEPTAGGGCALSCFLRLVGLENIPEVTRQRYAAMLKLKGFNLDASSFTSIMANGNRLHAATLPAVAAEECVDVQLVGPFKKASGLGQATRLSAEVMKQLPFSLNFCDFGMDNPAPEGFSSEVKLDEFKRARVNLIHLNAETVPLLYAYGPDAMSGAYNIGYFFWELETPALVHYLGMELLDEIWVSTEYGSAIYRRETGKPVVNVGMCYEELPDIDKRAAREKLNRRLNLQGKEFVVFTAFDSFSFTQRKNPLAVLSAFQKAFPDDAEARLVIKTQNRDFVDDPKQRLIWSRLDSAVERDPRIIVINETLAYKDLLALKAACDCYISLHRSEGWGFGMIEAMNLKVPVICTGYSGNMDFCSAETSWLVDYAEVPLDREDYIFVRKGQKWADPDVEHAARQLQAVRDDPHDRKRRVDAAYANVTRNFSAKAIAKRYGRRLQEIFEAIDRGASA